MRRKTSAPQPSQGSSVSTQEYIRRAIEEHVEDEDFQRNPWLSAMDLFTVEGTYYPLNTIKKKCFKFDRVDQVVAVIKSITRNGMGDLMVTLKDPTDAIDASIHRKVLTESEFASDIAVGSVLILKEVVVFTPTRSVRYLNITLGNVFKVFPKDG